MKRSRVRGEALPACSSFLFKFTKCLPKCLEIGLRFLDFCRISIFRPEYVQGTMYPSIFATLGTHTLWKPPSWPMILGSFAPKSLLLL